MALVSIIAANQTGSALKLTQLMAPGGEIPASGQVELTLYNWVEEVLRDIELLGFIQNDAVLLIVSGTALTKAQSLSFLDSPTVSVKVSYGVSSQGPSSTDDATQGWSIGSMWITTGGDAYTCVDATAENAVWKLPAALSDQDPLALGTTAPGTGTTASRYDHVHAHGDLPGSTLHADATNLVDGFMPFGDKAFANHAFDTGYTEGGALTYGTGLVINVAAGDGFVNDASSETTGVTEVNWTADTVTATADLLNYVYVTSGGVVSISTTHPSFANNIFLGTAFANTTTLTGLAHSQVNLQQHRGEQYEWTNHVIGGTAVEGLDASENATPLHIDVTAGEYYISGTERTATAATNISWTYWYSDGAGGWVTVPGVSAVDVTNYDDGSGTLAALPSNRWKKDLLFVTDNGDGNEYHMLYATREYTSQAAAEAGALPEHSDFLRRFAARFVGVVVQQGATNISSFVDEKPKIGQWGLGTENPTRIGTRWVPVQSSSSLSESSYGRQIVVPIASNGGGNITFTIPNEAVSLVSAKLYGIISSGAAASGLNIDFWTDYGNLVTQESPTANQESDLVSTYDFTGRTGLITEVADLVGILTNATGADIVGLEIKHNSIGGAIEYLGVNLVYEVFA